MADPFAVPTRKTSPPSNPSTPSSTKTHTTNNNRTPSTKTHKNNKTPSSKSKKSSAKHSTRKPNKSRKKIAFLFLVRRTLNQLAAWEEFFSGPMGKTHSTIYCHPKDPKDVGVKLLRDAVIAENVPTAWGNISVTRAILCMLKAALADPDNTKFVLCSESCVPLCTFRDLHNDVTTHQKSYFDFMALSDYINRYGQVTQPKPGQNRPFIPLSSFKKHATWWILDRKHAQICVTKQKQYLPSFKRVMVPDEHFFATVLWNESQQHDIICKQTTFVNWDANINWFYVKHRFCQRWGLNVLAAGSRLPKNKPGNGMYGKLPREAEKEWARIRHLDQDMHKNDLVAHPITHGPTTTLGQVKCMYESQAYFARKFTPDSNFMKLKKELHQQYNQHQLRLNSTAPVMDKKHGKFAIPQYLHSQLFEEMQASLAYLRSSIVEVNRRHVEEEEQKRNGGKNSGGQQIDPNFFDKTTSSTSSSSASSTNSSIDPSMGLPVSEINIPAPLIPLCALPIPPPHQGPDSFNVTATNQLQNMLGMMVTSDAFIG
jgi:hypothetical protein